VLDVLIHDKRLVLHDPARARLADAPPPSIWVAGLIPALVRVAHLIVYAVDRRRAS
jgi:hypothetical protein